jgi:hypothetical protein
MNLLFYRSKAILSFQAVYSRTFRIDFQAGIDKLKLKLCCVCGQRRAIPVQCDVRVWSTTDCKANPIIAILPLYGS